MSLLESNEKDLHAKKSQKIFRKKQERPQESLAGFEETRVNEKEIAACKKHQKHGEREIPSQAPC